jgi:hypothetical protein
LSAHLFQRSIVDIADRDNFSMTSRIRRITLALAADAYAGKLYLFVQ